MAVRSWETVADDSDLSQTTEYFLFYSKAAVYMHPGQVNKTPKTVMNADLRQIPKSDVAHVALAPRGSSPIQNELGSPR
jgi:hypothetical protein